MIRPNLAIGKLVATAHDIRGKADHHIAKRSFTTGFKLDSDARYLEEIIEYIKFLESRNVGAGDY